MDLSIIADVFVVVVVGGLGSVVGAYLAAVIISELNAFGLLVLPQITLVLPFLVMGAVLIARPYGLLGRPESGDHPPMLNEEPLRLLRGSGALGALGRGGAAGAVPAGGGGRFLAGADQGRADLHPVRRQPAFHHGRGRHGLLRPRRLFRPRRLWRGAAEHHGRARDDPLAPARPVVAGLGAALVGWFCVRRSGVYFAMLTLAAAQIVWSVAYQWYEVTGGDDGILGVWPARWASSREAFYYLALTLCLGGIWALRRMAHSPFGYTLRGGRDSTLRADAIGIDLKRHQWMGFVIAGVFSGLAGAVYVFSKGSVFPDELAIPRSFDALLMVLLGGVQALIGPILGAAAFTLLEDAIFRLEYWRLVFGLVILGIVILAPDGIAGGLRRLQRRLLPGRREGAP
jgi:branched-chain amino acid transport system permease protein